MAHYHLAQINIGTPLASLESPVMADFMNGLDRINALADEAPGFIWRLQTDDGNATALRPFGDETMVNLSVWRDVESLRAFVFADAHKAFLRRRGEWFERSTERILALWWVPAGHIPDLVEARAALDRLRAEGPGAHAFDLAHPFDPPAR